MATESQFTISPWKRRAIASARAVFPLAVGPRTTTTRGSRLVTLAHPATSTSATSAQAPGDVSPITDESENKQQNRHQKQSGGFRGINRMAVLMLAGRNRLRSNGRVHGNILACSAANYRLPNAGDSLQTLFAENVVRTALGAGSGLILCAK